MKDKTINVKDGKNMLLLISKMKNNNHYNEILDEFNDYLEHLKLKLKTAESNTYFSNSYYIKTVIKSMEIWKKEITKSKSELKDWIKYFEKSLKSNTNMHEPYKHKG